MITTTDNPYLKGIFAPVEREITADALEVTGEIPRDLDGMFVRNGSNPKLAPQGRYHWFDGDGMLHGVDLHDGKATYRNRWIRTEALAAEEAAGEALWTGILERPDFRRAGGPFKDTANTDLVFHAGRLLALWWLGGKCHKIALPSLETTGVEDYGGRLLKGLSAHPKLDPVTGELMFMDFDMRPPYLTYGVISAEGELVHQIPIDIPGARLQHDMAITEHHSILMDLPLMWDAELLARGKTRVRFHPDKPSRFGVIPRRGEASSIRWFEASACYMYHTINAWEEGDEIVLVGCRIDNPIPEGPRAKVLPELEILALEPYLHEWRFDLRTGLVREQRLDDVMTEFPRMNNAFLGRPSRYSYAPRLAPRTELLFDGFVKYDGHARTSTTCSYGEGRFGGETAFAPRIGATSEDDGYLITFVRDEREDRSDLWIVDARDVAKGPVARLEIPQNVPIGYHSWWVPASDMAHQRP